MVPQPGGWMDIALYALLGAFGTAYVHERTGREVSTGGWIGLVLGAILGVYGLASLWVWLLYRSPGLPVTVQNRRRRWYTWFLP